MHKYTCTLLRVDEPERNGRMYSRKGWNHILESEANKASLIPVYSEPVYDDSIPLTDERFLGFAHLSDVSRDVYQLDIQCEINAIKELAQKNPIFMPNFTTDKIIPHEWDGVPCDYIEDFELISFSLANEPAMYTEEENK